MTVSKELNAESGVEGGVVGDRRAAGVSSTLASRIALESPSASRQDIQRFLSDPNTPSPSYTSTPLAPSHAPATPKPQQSPAAPGVVSEALSTAKETVVGFGKVQRDFVRLCSWLGSKLAPEVKKFTELAMSDPRAAAQKVVGVVSEQERIKLSVARWVASKALAMGNAAVEYAVDAGKHSLEIGKEVVLTGAELGRTGARAVVDVGLCLLGQKSWSELGVSLRQGLAEASAHAQRAVALTESGVRAVWQTVKNFSDSFGLSDLLVGSYHMGVALPHLAWDLARCAVGRGSLAEAWANVRAHTDGAGRSVIGAVKCFGEVTGLTDAALTVKHSALALQAYGRGDHIGAAIHAAQAGMHGVFGAAGLYSTGATVATFGAAAPSMAGVAVGRVGAKQMLKALAKKGTSEGVEAVSKELLEQSGKEMMELFGKEGAETVLREVSERAYHLLDDAARAKIEAQLVGQPTREAAAALRRSLSLEAVLERLGTETADKGAKALSENVQKLGAEKALEAAAVEQTFKEAADTATSATLGKLRVSDLVGDVTETWLKQLTDTATTAEQVAHRFALPLDRAQQLLSNTRTLLHRGESDEVLKEALANPLSARLRQVVGDGMEKPFKKRFKGFLTESSEEGWQTSLKEAVETEAKRQGKDVAQFTDELVEYGWKGAREGAEASVHRCVREGVEQGFKRFREGKKRPAARVPAAAAVAGLRGDGSAAGAEEGLEEEGAARSGVGGSDSGGSSEEAGTKVETHDLGNGMERIVTMVFDPAYNRWVEVSSVDARVKRPQAGQAARSRESTGSTAA